MSNTLIVIALIIAAWWSGLLPWLLLGLGALLATLVIGALNVLESLLGSRTFRRLVRGPWRKLTGYEERQVKRLVARQRRRYPRMSVAELAKYEQRLRQMRSV